MIARPVVGSPCYILGSILIRLVLHVYTSYIYIYLSSFHRVRFPAINNSCILSSHMPLRHSRLSPIVMPAYGTFLTCLLQSCTPVSIACGNCEVSTWSPHRYFPCCVRRKVIPLSTMLLSFASFIFIFFAVHTIPYELQHGPRDVVMTMRTVTLTCPILARKWGRGGGWTSPGVTGRGCTEAIAALYCFRRTGRSCLLADYCEFLLSPLIPFVVIIGGDARSWL